MKIKIQVVIEHEDATLETIEEEISCLQRVSPSLETLGLTLAESKEILRLSGQRFYHCPCQPQTTKSFSPIAGLVSERTAPEFCYLQAKWSSLKSYGLTVKLLEEVLPLSANVATAMRTTHAVAEKLETNWVKSNTCILKERPESGPVYHIPKNGYLWGLMVVSSAAVSRINARQAGLR